MTTQNGISHEGSAQALDYAGFLTRKSQSDDNGGFAPVWMPEFLFDFQQSLVDWALRKGRAAIFADCGTGKTAMELVWAENVVRHTGRPVLLLTPLAVGAQTIAEAKKFGIEATRSSGAASRGINVTNYERLHRFNPNDFAGVVCDESSILKNFDGTTKDAVTEFMRRMRFRLLCTATAAPNDFVELGTSSEALGYLGHTDMLNRFFKNDVGNSTAMGRAWAGPSGGSKWRFKGHAEQPFWRWVASWARAMRRPSDLGFSDARFVLPPLVEREHVVAPTVRREGQHVALPAQGLIEQRTERRRTIQARCEKAAALVANTGRAAVAWCHLNDEADLLERLISDAVQVSGSDTDDEKESKFDAFARGDARVLVIKPVIGAWGLNWQHCAHMTFFAGYSFEQYYQAIRRSWRFGQSAEVVIDNVISDGEGEVLAARQRKAAQADRMFSELVRHMRDGFHIDRGSYGSARVEVPSWL